MPLLVISDLQKEYTLRKSLLGGLATKTLRAVDGVSFTIERGKTLGLVGESGCGKSTTAKLVLGTIRPSGGQIEFEGRSLPKRQDGEWRKLRQRLQMVYQDPLGALDRRLRVIDQIIEPLEIHNLMATGERRSAAEGVAHSVGLTPALLRSYPHQLSGGQRQRVVLARALIMRPSLLVCDEPVSALDVSVAAQVLNLLKDTQAEFNFGSLFISHDLKVIRQVSDEVAVMYLGRIVEHGAPDMVLHDPAHPYTEALVSAVPSARKQFQSRIILKGDPPSPMEMPGGCAFHPRCHRAIPICAEVTPELRTAPDGRKAACHLVSAVVAH